MSEKDLIIRVPSYSLEGVFAGSLDTVRLSTKLTMQIPFQAYLYCPKANCAVYDPEDGLLLYDEDDLAMIFDPFGGYCIRNPYGSLGKKDIILNDCIVAIVTLLEPTKAEAGYDYPIEKIDWLTSPIPLRKVCKDTPAEWAYANTPINLTTQGGS